MKRDHSRASHRVIMKLPLWGWFSLIAWWVFLFVFSFSEIGDRGGNLTGSRKGENSRNCTRYISFPLSPGWFLSPTSFKNHSVETALVRVTRDLLGTQQTYFLDITKHCPWAVLFSPNPSHVSGLCHFSPVLSQPPTWSSLLWPSPNSFPHFSQRAYPNW